MSRYACLDIKFDFIHALQVYLQVGFRVFSDTQKFIAYIVLRCYSNVVAKSTAGHKVHCRDVLFFARNNVFCHLLHYRSTKNVIYSFYIIKLKINGTKTRIGKNVLSVRLHYNNAQLLANENEPSLLYIIKIKFNLIVITFYSYLPCWNLFFLTLMH